MPDELVRREDQPSLPEQLTAQFYDWERKGRGWLVYPYHVALEPLFQPFQLYPVERAPTATDDARRPTLLSGVVDMAKRLLGQGAPSASHPPYHADGTLWEPEPEAFQETSGIIELQVSLPPAVKVTRDIAEHLLLALTSVTKPASFEVMGTAEEILVQLAARAEDKGQLAQQLRAHFPEAAVTESEGALRERWGKVPSAHTVVVDFGLSQEFMRPLRILRGLDPDPLTAVAGALSELDENEVGVLQVLFEPARAPWADAIVQAVTGPKGGSFFADAPEMPALARKKVETPLFAALVRVAAKSPDPARAWQLARGLAGALRQFSAPPSNELIPLDPEGLDSIELEEDLLWRTTHRLGMLLSVEELASLVHLPSASVRSPKLAREVRKTKAASEALAGHDIVLGENAHAGKVSVVTLSTEHRIRHAHVVGASGTGKSHLLMSLIIQDLSQGNGLAVLDPHGDLVDRVLGYVPEERLDDMILFDPADPEHAVGFNVLKAHTPLEKDLLASDLVAVFRRLSTSWGDQMTAVLANAVLAFLESEDGGTLADLRHFLVEKDFRRRFLRTVQDPEVVFFWEKEFPLLAGKPQAPILTRLNTFLRHRLVRHIVAQKETTLDFGRVMNEGKVFLAKLSQGAIGEENASLLGTLLVSKFHQIALARQEQEEARRRPFFLYIDEFHNFSTPSMAAILAGARKYRLGLTLAHQDLEQLRRRDPELLSAVLTNPATRVCFRVGDLDARKLAEGFSAFGPEDLQKLGVGEALCRVERADWDFNLRTFPLPPIDPEIAHRRRQRAVALARERYARPRAEVEATLRAALPRAEPATEAAPEEPASPVEAPKAAATVPRPPTAPPGHEKAWEAPRPTERPPAAPSTPGRGGPQHTYLQELIRRWAQAHEWRAEVEKPVLDGLGSVDVALSKGGLAVACEVAAGSSPEQELANAQKCLAAGFEHVAVVSADKKALSRARKHITSRLGEEQRRQVHFFFPEELFAFLEEQEAEIATVEDTVRGYKVKTRYKTVGEAEKEQRKKAIGKVIATAAKRLRGD